MPASRPLIAIPGLVLVTISVISMLVWTWNKCPDPVIDYGREVYVPWRLSQGQVLYRDINYFNGPLVPYFDALLFKLFGEGIHTLKIFNAIVIVLLAALIYAMVRAMSDDWAASVAGMLFPILFACQQIAGATFNFLTPYSYDLSLGVAMSIAMIACIWRAAATGGKMFWIVLAAIILGLIFLVKAEVFLAAFLGATAGLACLLWSMDPTPIRVVRICALLAACFVAPIIVAAILLSLAMPLGDTLRALAGSWKWIGDEQLSRMSYFRWMMGTDQLGVNILRMFGWTGAYLALLALGAAISVGVRTKSRTAKRAVALIAALLVAIPMIIWWNLIPWRGFLRPLPLAMLGVLVCMVLLLRIRQRPDAARFVLPLSFTVFSGVLLARTLFNIRSYHYGFALAMPAAMVFVAILLGWLPNWIASLMQRSPGKPEESAVCCTVRAVMIAALIGAGYAHIRMSDAWIAKRTNLVSANGDSFYAAEYGRYTQETIDFILANTNAADTLACMPEGLLINFMTRRVTPVPDMNFNPPSMVMYGEMNMLDRLKHAPPDWIALVGCDTSVYDAKFFGQHYARQISRWIVDNYDPVQLFGAPPFTGDELGIMILRRKPVPTR